MKNSGVLSEHLEKWNLKEPVLLASTPSSDVYKVEYQNTIAVLKIYTESGIVSEGNSSTALKSFAGHGVVKVFENRPQAILLEFLPGPTLEETLPSVSDSQKDNEALVIACNLLKEIHKDSQFNPENFDSLERRFKSLLLLAEKSPLDSLYVKAAKIAREVISQKWEQTLLHGDFHHSNIMLSADRGWVAIDPQSFVGERTYDIANLIYNPRSQLSEICSQEILKRRCILISQELNLELKRVYKFAFIYGCLSASWSLEDGQDASQVLAVADKIFELLETENLSRQ